jgi:hypothetical protein
MPASTEWFDVAARVAEPMREGAPLRVLVKHNNRTKDKRIGSYLGYRGLSYVCGHWRIVGPVVANDLCASLAEPGRGMFVSHLAGVEYFMVDRGRARVLSEIDSDPGRSPMRQIRRGGGHYLYRDSSAAFYSRADPTVLTIANDAQWLYVMRAWIGALRKEGGVHPPMPVLLPRGIAIDAELLAPFEAVWILDPEQVSAADARALDRFAKGSGKVITVDGIPGLGSAEILGGDKSLLTSVTSREADRVLRVKTVSRESNVGPFVLRVRADGPMVMVLPEFAVDGWTAKVNGVPRPVMRTGPEMVGVTVPAGKSRVVLAWVTPRLEAAALGISGIAWIGLFVAVVVGVSLRWRRRR